MSVKPALICLKCSVLAFFLLFLQAVSAQPGKIDLDAELKARQKQLGNELVVMLWKGDTLAYKKELGMFNSKTQAPMGACSRLLTTALVLVMVDEGKLSLDDKVSTYLPEFAKYGKNYITLRLCLANMTGISDKKMLEKKKTSSLEDEVNAFASREIRSNPGQDFWYGNIGCDIAARVLEVVSKKRFDVLIKQKLFNPLTMRRTSFSTLDASAVNPASGAMTTGDDFMQFLVMLLSKGMYKGKQVLSEKSIEELLRIETKPELVKYTPKAFQGFNYTLSNWALEEKDGKAAVLACPGFEGSWAMVDYCRGYACLLLAKTPLDEERTTQYLELKKEVDEQVGGACE